MREKARQRIETFIRHRRMRIRARACVRSIHVFTKREAKLAMFLARIVNWFYPLTLHGVLFAYMGNCGNCSAPINRFATPILGRLEAHESRPNDKIWFLTRHTIVCPHCETPMNIIGVYKSYDITDELKQIKVSHGS